MEYFAQELGAAMELHAANAPVTAARLLDRAQPAVTEVQSKYCSNSSFYFPVQKF